MCITGYELALKTWEPQPASELSAALCFHDCFCRSNYSVTPGLAVVMVGDRGDSKAYVESKKKACADVGFESYHTVLSGNISEELLLKVIAVLGGSSPR